MCPDRKRLSHRMIALLSLAVVTVSAQPASPDRIVAEWAVRMGGSVVLEGQRKPITDLSELPATDFYVHTLNFSGITQWASSLEDEMKRLPPLSHLKEVYVNGRLWYDQPIPLVASTLGLLSASSEIEKVIITKPVQTLIPLDDTTLKNLEPLKNLRELRAHQTRIAGLNLAPFTLRFLDLNYDRSFNDRGAA